MASVAPSSNQFPPAFEHLRELAVHAADRAWTALGHFFVAQSVLLLAWATIATVKPDEMAWRPWALMALSLVGIVTGVQWSMLTTRMWHYHLAYVEQLKKIWTTVGDPAWKAISDDIDKYWKTGRGSWSLKRFSANQMVLMSAPLLTIGRPGGRACCQAAGGRARRVRRGLFSYWVSYLAPIPLSGKAPALPYAGRLAHGTRADR